MRSERVAGRRPILVTGSHRSGTTWVGEMLDASGETSLIYEPFNPVLERTGLCTAEFRGFTYVNEVNSDRFVDPVGRTLDFSYDVWAAVSTLSGTHGTRKRLREWSQARRARRADLRPLMKDPVAVFSAEWLAREFGMSVVVMLRHPAAFVASILRLGWTHDFQEFLDQPALMDDHLEGYREEMEEMVVGSDLLDQAALVWKLIHHVVDGYRARNGDWQFVKHEDLALDPVGGFRELYGALGLRFGPEAESAVVEHSRAGNRSQAPTGVATYLKRDSAASLAGWRRSLTDEQVARIRRRVEPIGDLFYDDASW